MTELSYLAQQLLPSVHQHTHGCRTPHSDYPCMVGKGHTVMALDKMTMAQLKPLQEALHALAGVSGAKVTVKREGKLAAVPRTQLTAAEHHHAKTFLIHWRTVSAAVRVHSDDERDKQLGLGKYAPSQAAGKSRKSASLRGSSRGYRGGYYTS